MLAMQKKKNSFSLQYVYQRLARYTHVYYVRDSTSFPKLPLVFILSKCSNIETLDNEVVQDIELNVAFNSVKIYLHLRQTDNLCPLYI